MGDEWNSFLGRLSKSLTVTFSTQTPYLKTLFFFTMCRKICASQNRIQYVDMDLQFTSMLFNLKETEEDLSFLEVYAPPNGRVLQSLTHLLSKVDLGRGGAIFIDSMNSLQELLDDPSKDSDHSGANHKAAIILTLFQSLAARNSKLLLLSNVLRSRPHTHEGEVSWEKEAPGGRMIKLKSDISLTIGYSDSNQNRDKIAIGVSYVAKGLETDLAVGEKIELGLDFSTFI